MARDNGVTALDFPSTADGYAAHDDARIPTHTYRPDQSPLPADPALAERYARVFTPALAHYSPLVVERAEGSYLYTRDGQRYLDLGSGIATTNVGHSHPQVVAAAEAQLRRVTHLSITAYHEAPIALAERLTQVAPPGLSRVFFGNSGAEAVEGALKLAK